jgi:hypothetical protein
VRSPGPAGSPAGAAGVKPSQNRRLVSSDHGPRTSNSTTCCAIACSARFTDTRTVTDGTDTKIDQTAPRTSAPITAIGAAAYITNLGCAADQIGRSRATAVTIGRHAERLVFPGRERPDRRIRAADSQAVRPGGAQINPAMAFSASDAIERISALVTGARSGKRGLRYGSSRRPAIAGRRSGQLGYGLAKEAR